MPARGMERWLAHRLAHRLGAWGRGDGVCAHVEFPAPGEVVATAVEGATGMSADDEASAPRPGGVAAPGGRRHLHRPSRGALPWPLIWNGRGAGSQCSRTSTACSTPTPATGPSCSTPGARATTRTCPRTCAGSRSCGGPCARGSASRSRAERLATAVAVLEHDPACCALPERLSLFGPTRLPADHLAVLAALARHREVHLWLPHPSPALWDRVAPMVVGVPARRADPTADLRTPSAARRARPRRPGAAVAAGGLLRRRHAPPRRGRARR